MNESIATKNIMTHRPASYLERRLSIEATELPRNVPDLLRQAEERFGDAEAISFFEVGQTLSFRELARTTRQLADGLAQRGIGHGSHVAVMMPNRIEYPITWLALATLGAVMVPVITGYTARELEFLLDDADVSHLVIDAQYLSVLRGTEDLHRGPDGPAVIVVGDDPATGAVGDFDALLQSGRVDFAPARQPEPDDLLNIQYTSGTTGLPKGVMQSHRFWVQAGCAPMLIWQSLGIRRILSDHPFHYIDPQWMLLAGLFAGTRVDYTQRMSVKRFMGWVKSRGSELAWFAEPLLKDPPREDDSDNPVKLFLAYHFSAEMLREGARRFGAAFREAYGMTEIGMGLCVPPDIEDEAILGTCGLPGPWREFRVVDEAGLDVPRGTAGELWVRGIGLCDGYYKRPEANASTFVDGWFRTGDLFVQDEHGFYRIVGRLKDMIKRSGENISAAEVERVLLELPEVVDAAAVPVPDAERDEEVKVYLLLREGLDRSALPPERVAAHCAARLAKFKVPRYLAYVDSLPYTPSEKVAKHQLVAGSSDLRAGAYDSLSKVWL